MFLLRPRVGKINMQRSCRVRRQQIFQKIRRLNADAAHIRQSGAPAFFVEFLDPSQQPLDPDEICIRIPPGIFHEERSVATTEFHFERLRFGENYRQSHRLQDGTQFHEQTFRRWQLFRHRESEWF